jgi:hypothetical protein
MSISSVTSEALQLKLRQLLPSQQGFGTDLSASDTIIPIIDLTASAEGSDVRADLQTAISFSDATAFEVSNTSTTVANTSGFYRIVGSATAFGSAGGTSAAGLQISDGSTTKDIFQVGIPTISVAPAVSESFDFVIWLNVGDSLIVTSNLPNNIVFGSVRQIADTNGELSQPTGFNPQ